MIKYELNPDFTVRRMTRTEVAVAEGWAAMEGWNPGNYDADYFYSTDPCGFLAGELGGRLIGCIFAVSYSDDFVFIGCYLVRPEFRNRGFGKAIWKAALTHLDNRNIGLDSVLEQEDNYRASGFSRAYLNLRFQGTVGGDVQSNVSENVVPLSKVPLADVIKYDSELFPAPRPQFLQNWINQAEGASFGLLQIGHLKGYGIIRACKVGFKIEPLFADDENIAEALFGALTEYAGGETVFMDIPEVNPSAILLAERHGMKMFTKAVRMYNRSAPELPMNRIFGVTTLQLG